MNILVTGASGFIASKLVGRLILEGHNVTCCVRNVREAEKKFPGAKIIPCNFEKDVEEKAWLDRFENIDTLINCVGILSSFFKKKIWQIHYETPKVFFDAAVKKGVKKIIQISAFGIEHSTTEYAKSKKAADEYLMTLRTCAVIVRPSMVYSTGSYGGSSLFRGLASLPYFIVVPGRGDQLLQPIFFEDIAQGILKIVNDEKCETQILNFVGPEKISLKNILMRMREWLGMKKAIVVNMPEKIISFFSFLGDVFRFSTINSTSNKMLMQNNIATEDEQESFFRIIKPKKMSEVFLGNPSYVQDKWHAKLYLLRPFLRLSIGFVFVASGVTTLFLYPQEKTFELMNSFPFSSFEKNIFLYGASFVDIILGIFTLINYKLKQVGIIQCAMILIYTVIISIFSPVWWLHPFGPIIKNLPVFVAVLIMISLESS